jgi:hypothetical protein
MANGRAWRSPKTSVAWQSNGSQSARTLSGWRRSLVSRDRPYIDGIRRANEPSLARNSQQRNRVNDGFAERFSDLKRLFAEKTLEVDFFRGALQRVEARHRESSGSGEQASTTTSGT